MINYLKQIITNYLEEKAAYRYEQAVLGATSGGIFIEGDKSYNIQYQEMLKEWKIKDCKETIKEVK